jgi:hypothetical protein
VRKGCTCAGIALLSSCLGWRETKEEAPTRSEESSWVRLAWMSVPTSSRRHYTAEVAEMAGERG